MTPRNGGFLKRMDYVVSELALNKKNILLKITDEEIFRYYIGNFKIGKSFNSPIRPDKNPSFTIYRIDDCLIFKDFATGETGNCFSFVMKLFNCDYETALAQVNIDFHLNLLYIKIGFWEPKKYENLKKTVIKEPANIKVTKQDFKREDILYWKSFGINQKCLEFYNVSSCKYVYLNDKVVKTWSSKRPLFAYSFLQDGHILYKIYDPLGPKTDRFLGNTNNETIQGLEQCFLFKNKHTLVITKSLKDVMLFASFNIPAIAFNSETIMFTKECLKKFSSFEHIVLFYDFDDTGKIKSKSLFDIHEDRIKKIMFTNLASSKDPSDYYRTFGHEATKRLLLKVYD